MGIKLKDILLEKFTLDLEVGDTILRGKFKNKPVVVKDFGVDDKGQPTINGKKMLSFRIKKLMPTKIKEESDMIKLTDILNEGDSWLSVKISKALETELKRTAAKEYKNKEFQKAFSIYLKGVSGMKYSDLGQKRQKHLDKAWDYYVDKTDPKGYYSKLDRRYLRTLLDGPVYAMLVKDRYGLEKK